MLKEPKMNAEVDQLNPTMDGTLYLEVSARLSMDPTELMEKYTGRLLWFADGGDYVVGEDAVVGDSGQRNDR